MTFTFAIACLEAKKQQIVHQRRVNKTSRANTCVLSLPDARFIKLFRVDKETFKWILRKIQPDFTLSYLTPALQLAATLHFLATGSYKLSVSKNRPVNIGRSTFSRILHNVIPLMEAALCQEAITLQMTQQQIKQSRDYFYENYQLPRVVACVDGLQIRILKPVRDETIYFNDKDYYSINAMLVCNYNMEILAIDCTHPGSCSDHYIWSNSQAREYLSRNVKCHYVLADTAYALENYVLTPYKNADQDSVEQRFNERHAAARSVVERTINLLKSRFGCMQRALMYDARFVANVVNVCCALHNICRRRRTPIDEREILHEETAEFDGEVEYEDDDTGALLRDEIACTLR
ncbi:putative nuclease HARBI1 [Drosophila montana]|uniref:putative nuclease HARBI1 n=1 Tax=Drosophila montana TaxID=40370 RepID=UPI00313DC8E6